MSHKSVIADLIKGEKLDGNNYEIWSRKVHFLLEAEDVADHILTALDVPTPGEDTEKYDKELQEYREWQKKDRVACSILLSAMQNDLLNEFWECVNAKELWDSIKAQYGGISAPRLRTLVMKFELYKMNPAHDMVEHLRLIAVMIRELLAAGHQLSDEQQVHATLRSLPPEWDNFVMTMIHRDDVVKFKDVRAHLEMEAERRGLSKGFSALMVQDDSEKKREPKRARPNQKKAQSVASSSNASLAPKKGSKKRRGARGGKKKKDKSKVSCFVCGKLGHFARECADAKKVIPDALSSVCVCSHVLIAADNSPMWVIDTGATRHIAQDRGGFTSFRCIPEGSHTIFMGNSSQEKVLGIGSYELQLESGRVLVLDDVLYAPGIRRNLVSVSSLVRCGFSFTFDKYFVSFYLNDELYGSGTLNKDFYILSLSYSHCFVASAVVNSELWHARLGHIGVDRMTRLARGGLLGQLAKVKLSTCEPCLMGKAARKPFGKATRADAPLDLIHSDICGPFSVQSRNGFAYFITFIDDYSRYGYVYLITHKSDALTCFRRFVAEAENQLGRTIKVLRTDRGREYLSQLFEEFCSGKGIRRQLTTPHTPQQNGVAERRNRTLLEMVRSMMAAANLPSNFWGDALLTATYILNRVPSKSVNSTPYELWNGRQPSLDHLRPWGAAGYVRIPTPQQRKLDPRGRKGIFIRYPEHSKGYVMICERPDGGLIEIESRDVSFIETEFPSRGDVRKDRQFWELDEEEANTQPLDEGGIIPRLVVEDYEFPDSTLTQREVAPNSGSTPMEHVEIAPISGSEPAFAPQDGTPVGDPISSSVEVLREDSTSVGATQETGNDAQVTPDAPSDPAPHELRRSQRVRIPRKRYAIEDEALVVAPREDDEPRSYREALSSPASEEWKTAMQEEIDSMAKNRVWELVDLPAGRKAIGNKWVLKIKRSADGSIDKYKARLVAKGFTQTEGVDYDETFSPVVRISSIRLILAFVAHYDLELHQMDVKTAFLNGELDEEIYMAQPEGFEADGLERRVCRLNKSIYGLKQSSRQWYLRFHSAIIEVGFEMTQQDHCVYVKRSKKDVLILSLYVDDILIAGSNIDGIVATKEWLSSMFEMKDLGEANFILGIKITRDRSERLLSMSQETYIKKVLERFNMSNAKPVDTPLDKGVALTRDHCPRTEREKQDMAKIPYASAVGSLMYAMLCTRPDICQAVGVVSRFQSNFGQEHWKAVKRILRYLRGTADYQLCYRGGDIRLRGYSDADWGSDVDERKSTSGFVFILADGAISWCSKKQPCIALSTMEAEYIACSAAAQEAVWLRRFYKRLSGRRRKSQPVKLYTDSTSGLALIKDSKYHGKAKHIQTRYHYVRTLYENKKIDPVYVPTADNVADPLTKPLARVAFQRHIRAMGLMSV